MNKIKTLKKHQCNLKWHQISTIINEKSIRKIKIRTPIIEVSNEFKSKILSKFKSIRSQCQSTLPDIEINKGYKTVKGREMSIKIFDKHKKLEQEQEEIKERLKSFILRKRKSNEAKVKRILNLTELQMDQYKKMHIDTNYKERKYNAAKQIFQVRLKKLWGGVTNKLFVKLARQNYCTRRHCSIETLYESALQ